MFVNARRSRHFLRSKAARAGGRRDRKAVDGLIAVDLRKTDTRVLERYMGKDGAAKFWNG
jgi:hypothetical protein